MQRSRYAFDAASIFSFTVSFMCAFVLVAATGVADCKGQFLSGDGVLLPRVWSAPAATFDTIGYGLMTLYELASLEGASSLCHGCRAVVDANAVAVHCAVFVVCYVGWMSVLYAGMDSRGVGMQPQRYASPAAALFFVAFIVLVCFCTVQLLIGVFVETYTRFNGNALLTRKQRYWVELQRRLGTFPLPAPEPDTSHDPLRQLAQRVMSHPALAVGVYVTIGVNAFLVALQHTNSRLRCISLQVRASSRVLPYCCFSPKIVSISFLYVC